MLKYLLKLTGTMDEHLVDFSMKLARDGAWKFGSEYFGAVENEKTAFFCSAISESAKL